MSSYAALTCRAFGYSPMAAPTDRQTLLVLVVLHYACWVSQHFHVALVLWQSCKPIFLNCASNEVIRRCVGERKWKRVEWGRNPRDMYVPGIAGVSTHIYFLYGNICIYDVCLCVCIYIYIDLNLHVTKYCKPNQSAPCWMSVCKFKNLPNRCIKSHCICVTL